MKIFTNPFKPFIFKLLLILLSTGIWAQTESNRAFLHDFAAAQQAKWEAAQERVLAYAEQHDIALFYETSEGRWVRLVDVVDGQPVYDASDNVGAALTTRTTALQPGGQSGLDLTGTAYDRLGIWDGGRVLHTHVEFMDEGVSRVTQIDNPGNYSDHATHVAGTMMAAGIDPDARGMAIEALLKAYDSSNDLAEMTQAALNGMEISNHSYSQITGWSNHTGSWQWYGDPNVSSVEDYRFGFYGPQSRSWDVLAYNAPYYLMSKSAGNNRGRGPSWAGQDGNPEIDGGEDGFDCIPDRGTAKNILTIGAVYEVPAYTNPGDVEMSNFSGWGPCDDGRIKPDIVAKGVGVYSAGSDNNTHYSSKNGTSMSTPNAAGSMALLQQHYQNLNEGNSMLSSTLKGLVIHAADEAGDFPGPDYTFGWGLMNTTSAANIITENHEGQWVMDEILLENGAVYEREVDVAGGNPLRVTICWTDPAGDLLPPALNDRTPILKHDLDLRIEDENGNVYYPWKLNPDEPAMPAVRDSKNHVDNVEMVLIDEAQAGTYTIIVDHEGVLNPDQVFSIIVTGTNNYDVLPYCSEELLSPADQQENAFLNQEIAWAPAVFATSYDVYFGTDGEGETPPGNIYDGVNFTSHFFHYNMEPATTYYLMAVPRNNQGTNDECAIIWSFTTMPAVDDYPYFVDVQEVNVPELPEFWQAINHSGSELGWTSTQLLGYSGNKSMVCYSIDGQLRHFNNWLISPPLQVDAEKEYKLTYYYRGFFPNTPERLSVYWGTAADTTHLVNLAYADEAIAVSGWLKAEALLVPDHDGHIFLGWLADNENGLGVFVDAVMIEDWGPVGVDDPFERQLYIQYRNESIKIQSDRLLEQAAISIVNASGQQIMHKQLGNGLTFEVDAKLATGLYIIQLQAGEHSKSVKIMVF